jgi:hypothetical protein
MATIREFSTLEEAQEFTNKMKLEYPFCSLELLTYIYDSGKAIYGVKLIGEYLCDSLDF